MACLRGWPPHGVAAALQRRQPRSRCQAGLHMRRPALCAQLQRVFPGGGRQRPAAPHSGLRCAGPPSEGGCRASWLGWAAVRRRVLGSRQNDCVCCSVICQDVAARCWATSWGTLHAATAAPESSVRAARSSRVQPSSRHVCAGPQAAVPAVCARALRRALPLCFRARLSHTRLADRCRAGCARCVRPLPAGGHGGHGVL